MADASQYIATLRQRFRNFYMQQSDQFYSSGQCTLQLAPGTYDVKAFKGIEYLPVSRRIQVEAGAGKNLELRLFRWVNMPKEGWYSSDAHLHIPRPTADLNDHFSKWMAAEDLHVANLLQWGHSHHVSNALQYAHGQPGVYQDGNYILASGQEAPRTPILGHTIMLGTIKPIHLPERYLLYRDAFEEGRRQGTVNGYAHHGIFFHAQNGLAFDLTTGLVDFIEVLQGGTVDYSAWYLALNSGFRLTPWPVRISQSGQFRAGTGSMRRSRAATRSKGGSTPFVKAGFLSPTVRFSRSLLKVSAWVESWPSMRRRKSGSRARSVSIPRVTTCKSSSWSEPAR